MYYYNPTVKQCLDRKGKPWRASIDYKDPTTGKRKQKTKMLPNAKGKKRQLGDTYEKVVDRFVPTTFLHMVFTYGIINNTNISVIEQ